MEQIKQVLDNETGKELKTYLLEKLEELKSIDNVRELSDPLEQSIELKAQKKAYYQLMSILNTIMSIQDMKIGEKDSEDLGL